MQVRPELVQTSTGSTLWQQSFEAPINDVFQVQADIAGQVAVALDVALAVRERERLARGPTRDPAAYDLFLRGRHAFRRRTADGLNEARRLFEEAITQDPRFARAYAGLAEFMSCCCSGWTCLRVRPIPGDRRGNRGASARQHAG